MQDRRQAAIEAALARRNFAAELQPRIERLLDGIEDRHRLRCCNSGCYVCVQQLLAILEEVEAAVGTPVALAPAAPAREPCQQPAQPTRRD
jgi:hypothetical protein